MGRTAKAYLHGYQIYTLTTDIPRSEGRPPAHKIWDNLFANYHEDQQGRLVYAYQPLCSGAGSIEGDIKTIANDIRPSAEERFETVEIINEETGEVLNTLHDVDLIGILEGIKKEMERWKGPLDGALRAALLKVANRIRERAIDEAPYRKGYLKKSISVHDEFKDSVIISAGDGHAPYAVFVHEVLRQLQEKADKEGDCDNKQKEKCRLEFGEFFEWTCGNCEKADS